jgi:hypothetical protein
VWQGYRQGQIVATLAGLAPNGPCGREFMCEGILHDIASLNKMEPLCQDQSSLECLAVADAEWDQWATWTCDPDSSFRQLHAFHSRNCRFSTQSQECVCRGYTIHLSLATYHHFRALT